jgi:hypothetical protein
MEMLRYKRYKVELTIDFDQEWTGDEPKDWDWSTLMDCGAGMELTDVVVDELVTNDC